MKCYAKITFSGLETVTIGLSQIYKQAFPSIQRLNTYQVIGFINENQIEEHTIDGLLFKQIITVTTISGGSANNVIPSHVNLNINFRFLPTQNESEVS